jgi:hypothetical protein
MEGDSPEHGDTISFVVSIPCFKRGDKWLGYPWFPERTQSSSVASVWRMRRQGTG